MRAFKCGIPLTGHVPTPAHAHPAHPAITPLHLSRQLTPPEPAPHPQVSLRHFTEFAAFVCEMFVFAYLGLQVATMQHAFDFGLFFTGAPRHAAGAAQPGSQAATRP